MCVIGTKGACCRVRPHIPSSTLRICAELTGDKLLSVVAHEVGHLLGLDHVEGGVMGKPRIGVLPSADDLALMRALYP